MDPLRRQKITLQPAVLRWARTRAGLSEEELASKLNVRQQRVKDWEQSGEISGAQIDNLAAKTHTPLGFLFLAEPRRDRLPITDFRTHTDALQQAPTPDLLETVYLMQRRQAWMRDELIGYGAEPLEFVGVHSLESPVLEVASAMREVLNLEDDWAGLEQSWTAALGRLRDKIEDIGILVVINGVVGNDSHRKLSSQEFQGFAMADQYAPLIFVNGTDFKAAQMFTLAHELAHLFVSESGVSRFLNMQPAPNSAERFCDRAAAEFLVPGKPLLALKPDFTKANVYREIAQHFKVSQLVAGRRALDLELIDRDTFFQFYNQCLKRYEVEKQNSSTGGNFWANQRLRIGQLFATAVVCAAKEGRLPYREAYSLTGLKGKSFDSLQNQAWFKQ